MTDTFKWFILSSCLVSSERFEGGSGKVENLIVSGSDSDLRISNTQTEVMVTV